MRTAILGGTFNPPHKAHTGMAQAAIEQHGFDRVLVIPTAQPPHKRVQGDLSPEQRLLLTRCAFSHLPGVEVSDIELRRQGASFTLDTVAQLRELYPAQQFSLLVGADMFFSVETWSRAEQLIATVPLVAFPRVGEAGDLAAHAGALLKKYPTAQITVSDVRLPQYSSTALREQLAEGLTDAVPARALRAILEHGFYGVRYDASRMKTQQEQSCYTPLCAKLSVKRVWHSLSVMETAERLAPTAGCDPAAARLAGLLHDITKDLGTHLQLRMAEENGIIISNLEAASPKLLHAITGARLAEQLLGDGYGPVISAIRYHTTGREHMTALERLIYLADYIEPLRDFPGVEQVRQLAARDLTAATLRALDGTIGELIEAERPIHPDTLLARNRQLMLLGERSSHA